MEEVRRTVRKVMTTDSEDVTKLTVRKQRVGEALQSIPARREMLSAYGQREQGLALDQTDE